VDGFYAAFPHQLSGGNGNGIMIRDGRLILDLILLDRGRTTTPLDVTTQLQILKLNLGDAGTSMAQRVAVYHA